MSVCVCMCVHISSHNYSFIFGVSFLISEVNKVQIVKEGAILPLLRLSHSLDPKVQRNAAGALLNLTHIG